MLTRRALVARALVVPLAGFSLSRLARADGVRPRVEVVVLHALRDQSVKNSPQLGPGVPKFPQLSQPPFDPYNAFALVGQSVLSLAVPKTDDPWKGKPSGAWTLATGKPLAVVLLGELADRRFHMAAVIGHDAPDIVRWDAPCDEPVFIAGQSYKGGILVIVITLRAP